MSESVQKLNHAPIVEAVLDIDCDLKPGLQIAELENAARTAFQPEYPKVRTQFIEHHKIEAIFKAVAKAIKMALQRDDSAAIPSTKGIL